MCVYIVCSVELLEFMRVILKGIVGCDVLDAIWRVSRGVVDVLC